MKELKPSKDTSIFMMEEAISLGYKVYQAEMKHLYVDEGYVYVDARNIEIEQVKLKESEKNELRFQNFVYFYEKRSSS